jgi:hypothetical protein
MATAKQPEDTMLLGLGVLCGVAMTITLIGWIAAVQRKAELKAQERVVCELHAGYQETEADTVALIKSMPNCAVVFYEQR